MKSRSWILVLALLTAACGESGIADRYRAEREVARVEFDYLKDKRSGKFVPRPVLRDYAARFEAAALTIAAWTSVETPATRTSEGRAWLRAVECHLAALDSGRAELILATLVANHSDLPEVAGPVHYQLGLTAESRGAYPVAIEHFRKVVRFVEPDPGPDPDEIYDPEAIPEEETVDDFVLGLPLRALRLALRDSTATDTGSLYDEAVQYYRGHVDDPSAFIRIEATRRLADVEADRGNWAVASALMDSLEHRVPRHAAFHYPDWEIRYRSFSYQVRAREWGDCTEDSLRTLLAALVEDYPRGEAAPSAVLDLARSESRIGEAELALADLQRLRRSWPMARVTPDAELLLGQLYDRIDDRSGARRTLAALPREFPTSEAALEAPLVLAAQYRARGDTTGEHAALREAERGYREVLERYPRGEHTLKTREQLVQTLSLLGQHDAAIRELLAMCEVPQARAQVPSLLLEAARRAEFELQDRERAALLFQRLADDFPDTRIGRRAVRDAHRLRTQVR